MLQTDSSTKKSTASTTICPVVVTDDHLLFRFAIRTILSKSKRYTVVGEASNLSETISLVESLRPSLLTLDLSLPDGDGLEIIERIRSLGLPIKIVVISMYEDESKVRQSVVAGADGYLIKSAPARDLLRALDQVQEGKTIVPEQFSYLIDELKSGSKSGRSRVRSSGPLGKLSKREAEIFQLLASGVPNREIARQLSISARTVETHRARLMKKLSLQSSAEIIKFSIKHKLVPL